MLAFHYRPNHEPAEPYTPPTWADGTDEEIAEAVAKADAGEIDLTDYWSVGDERTVGLSAMSATGDTFDVNETHAAQDVTFVIMNVGYNVTDVDNSNVNFVVGLKNSLNTSGVMNQSKVMNGSSATNAINYGGWNNSARRKWCNSIFYASFPDTIKDIFKLFRTKTANGGSSNYTGIQTSQDRFALFAEKEVFGSKTYCRDEELSQLNQINYYTTATNRIKQTNGSNNYWWERSPYGSDTKGFCCVNGSGSTYRFDANNTCGIAPFGCI